MGKYSHLKGKLDNYQHESEYQKRIDEEKLEIHTLRPGELAERLVKLRVNKGELGGQLSEVNMKLEAINQILINWLESEAITSLKTEDGTTLYIRDEPYCSIEDQRKLYAWIKKTKHTELVGVRWQTLNALVKEQLTSKTKMGQIPPGVKVFIKSSIGARKAS